MHLRSREQEEYDNGVKSRDCSCGMHIFIGEYSHHLKKGEHNTQMGNRKGQVT